MGVVRKFCGLEYHLCFSGKTQLTEMRKIFTVVLAFVVILSHVALIKAMAYLYDLRDAKILFAKFMKDYNKHYDSEAESLYRYKVFVENLKKMNQDNLEYGYAVNAINGVADLTQAEFAKKFGNIIVNRFYNDIFK